ncbi:hypothetical protein [Streptomyces sp. CA-132043]|uniref:hypothetical protein n=1 Tax=Streptomyces sp. CA-132043 TaxID=3240048 RepID=UPI003D8EE293
MNVKNRSVLVGALAAATLASFAVAPAQAKATHAYTSNKCGGLTFDDVGEYLVVQDFCADGAGVVGYYSAAGSSGHDKAVSLPGGEGSNRVVNKSWPEGRLMKFKVCQYQPGTVYGCSKYMQRWT